MLKKHTKHIIYIAIGLTVLFLLYALKNTSYFLRILGFFVAIFLFWAVDTFFNLKFKEYHYLIILLISTFGILLSPLYFISPIYDKILHLVAPILAGILVFFLVNKLETKFSIKLVLTFSIILSLLAMFEIVEYALDSLLNLKLQGVFLRDHTGVSKLKLVLNKNDDTMIDLILGVIGSGIFLLGKTLTFNLRKYKIIK